MGWWGFFFGQRHARIAHRQESKSRLIYKRRRGTCKANLSARSTPGAAARPEAARGDQEAAAGARRRRPGSSTARRPGAESEALCPARAPGSAKRPYQATNVDQEEAWEHQAVPGDAGTNATAPAAGRMASRHSRASEQDEPRSRGVRELGQGRRQNQRAASRQDRGGVVSRRGEKPKRGGPKAASEGTGATRRERGCASRHRG